MGDLPGFGGIWRTLVGEWEKNLIIFIFFFGLMGGDRARWEIYLVSEECRGRWWDSGKKFNYFLYLYLDSRMGGDRARWDIYLLSEECRGCWWTVGKNLIFFIFVFGFT